MTPGEEGEVVLTNLERETSPLLRFANSDKVIYFPFDACDCGRPYDIIEAGSIERYDDMIKMKATNVWPAAVDGVIFSYDEVVDVRGLFL